ncbi:MAG: HAD-IB family hydrolase [Azoarcus sp.]|jgi:HAD superfamily hydrolase (TIGR01490 family)|nr:HAD-IB family hydrolase [Azoarcus sp.]
MDLVLFDLDNTLLAGDSDVAWTQFLIEEGVLDASVQEMRNLVFYEQYKAGTLDIHAFLDFQLAPLARYPRTQLDVWHRLFMDRHIRPMIPNAARQLVDGHLQSGALVALVTATNSYITWPIAREFGIAHLVATIPAQENGIFTGKPKGIPTFQAGKVARTEDWLESMGLNFGCFDKSWFYSDSHNDLPLLQKVTHPIAVDPDEILRAVAQEHHWKILSLHSNPQDNPAHPDS